MNENKTDVQCRLWCQVHRTSLIKDFLVYSCLLDHNSLEKKQMNLYQYPHKNKISQRRCSVLLTSPIRSYFNAHQYSFLMSDELFWADSVKLINLKTKWQFSNWFQNDIYSSCYNDKQSDLYITNYYYWRQSKFPLMKCLCKVFIIVFFSSFSFKSLF